VSRAADWVRASRPLALANIALPLLLGQAFAYRDRGVFDGGLCALSLAFGVLDQLFIVYANDYADRHADTEARTPFSGGSGVLVEGRIAPRALGRAAVGAGLLLGVLSLGIAWSRDRPLTVAAWAAAIALLWAYSYAPLRLSFRGGGEVLQAVGVGWVLPWLGFYLQTGDPEGFPPGALAPLFLVGYAGNVLTAIPDHEADRAADKRTFAVRFGRLRARRAVVLLLLLATALAAREVGPVATRWPFVLPLAPLAATLPHLRHEPPHHEVRFVFLTGLALNLLLLVWGTRG